MSVYGVRILVGDVRARLRDLPDESVHCVVTSPPYWGLRDYGIDGQLGLERTPEEYVARMVEVFREVRRVMRQDATLWMNLGDSYAQSGMGGNPEESEFRKQATNAGSLIPGHKPPPGLKPKDLVGVPWMLAFALRADGWWLRSEIIWHKPNPMPESVTDRPTKSHEQVFLLAKSARYYYDADAVREKTGTAMSLEEYQAKTAPGKTWPSGGNAQYAGAFKKDGGQSHPAGRNLRSVWTIPSHAFPDAHFATYPPKLVEPCVKAGCPVGGTVLDPFGGAGTTALVAVRLQRHAILIELNPEYAAMARKRIEDDSPLFARVEVA